MTEPELRSKLQEVREREPWAANYADVQLLTTIKKYPNLFTYKPDPGFFEWGVDPVTGALTKVGEAAAMIAAPAIQWVIIIAGLFLAFQLLRK